MSPEIPAQRSDPSGASHPAASAFAIAANLACRFWSAGIVEARSGRGDFPLQPLARNQKPALGGLPGLACGLRAGRPPPRSRLAPPNSRTRRTRRVRIVVERAAVGLLINERGLAASSRAAYAEPQSARLACWSAWLTIEMARLAGPTEQTRTCGWLRRHHDGEAGCGCAERGACLCSPRVPRRARVQGLRARLAARARERPLKRGGLERLRCGVRGGAVGNPAHTTHF
jgi:hypothetical protein